MAALAKINAPQLPDAFPRERLYALLDAAAAPVALWVCAPPGAGKTCGGKPLWYRVDEGNADPATLFYNLGIAATQVAPCYVTFPHGLDAIARLCARSLEAGIEPDYVRHIIRKRKLLAPSPEIEAWPGRPGRC